MITHQIPLLKISVITLAPAQLSPSSLGYSHTSESPNIVRAKKWALAEDCKCPFCRRSHFTGISTMSMYAAERPFRECSKLLFSPLAVSGAIILTSSRRSSTAVPHPEALVRLVRLQCPILSMCSCTDTPSCGGPVARAQAMSLRYRSSRSSETLSP